MAVALVGLPGAGKSAVGRRLGARLNTPFIDTDHVIEQRIGCSIRDYFEREGETVFRDLEQTVIADLAANAHGVLATGGGAVLREANRSQLRDHFHVIYLRSSPEDLFRRLRHDVKRPLLQVADPLGRLRELHDARDPLYRETAHDVVDTGRPSIAMLVNIIVMQLELAGVVAPGAHPEEPTA
ncbi:AAA family ATPase [Variovorax sp. RKNM96]|uniref:shikimate kinase n=1 Tax=Variovorax sp. RKNM96 TaxID=2681552 RepID=UPI001981DEA5|nr:shikimate kinase [Variovorax sp. RKNM96]QSI29170.1 AAA family ATPase [Variovorax sp. RKNM96]